jgi:hypothetical protein
MHFARCCPAGICTIVEPGFKVEGGGVTDVVVVQHETHIDEQWWAIVCFDEAYWDGF